MRSRGYSPSLREIGDAVGLASTSSVSHQLSVLEANGYLIREAGRPRTMLLRGPGRDGAGRDGAGPDGVGRDGPAGTGPARELRTCWAA